MSVACGALFCASPAEAFDTFIQPFENCSQTFLPAVIPYRGDKISESARAEIARQVARSFEEKFSRVTRDIPTTSHENLLSIEKALRERMGTKKFDAYFAQADESLSALKKNIVIQSETSFDGAMSVLDSGNFLSLDEMVREGIVPLEKKNQAATKYDIDGVIGQQDTVYLAIKPTDIPPNRPMGIEWPFGPVQFRFSEGVIDRGYFSPYAFDHSPSGFNLWTYQEPPAADRIDRSAALYRKFVFSGQADYEKLLKLSLTQSLWEQERREILLGTLFPEAKKEIETLVGSRFGNEKIRHYPSFPESKVCRLFKFLGQSCPREIDSSLLSPLENNQVGRISGNFGPTLEVLGAYSGFPISSGDTGISLAHMWGAWELKIPRRLALNEISSIRIQTSGVTTGVPVKAEQVTAMIEKVKQYARSRGLKIHESREFDEARIKYDIERGYQANRSDYEVIRLDLVPQAS